MNGLSENPWAARFSAILDKDEIVRRATLVPAPLGDISNLAPEVAAARLKAQMESVYYPTDQVVDILYSWVGLAYQHCLDYYRDQSFFLNCVYSERPPAPEFRPLICLTGQAGSGKTELIKAFHRIQELPEMIFVDPEHPPFPLVPHWSLTVHANGTSKDLLSALSGGSGTPRDLVQLCRRQAYRDGVAFLINDEFQFATGSTSANARVTQMLLSAGYLGLPPVYAANFSLLHRLMKRPAEDRHRLLSNPIILLPEAPSSNDWNRTLQAQKDAAPHILVFDPAKDGPAIHRYSAGDMRAEVALLVCAYRIGRTTTGLVSLNEIELAYHCTAYTAYRRDVEALMQLSLGDSRVRKQRKDLWCPLDLPEGAVAQFASRARAARQARADDQAAQDSLTQAERKALAAMEKSRQPKKASVAAKVFDMTKNGPATAAERLANFQKFRDLL